MQTTGDEIANMRAALEWYRDMGVDIALGDEPVDRFAAPKASLPPAAIATPHPFVPEESGQQKPVVAQSHHQPETHNVEDAKKLAAAAKNLEELRGSMAAFEGCPLRFRATNMVFADGNPQADLMFVGEAPGRDEDIQGLPFVGRSGQLLDRILGSIQLDREKVFIANTLPWRPPGNRNPTPAEITVCLPFLERQIELVSPKIIVTLGGAAAKTLFKTDQGILRLRGKWRTLEIGAHKCEALATLHPAYLLRQPAQKSLVWRDMLALKNKLSQSS